MALLLSATFPVLPLELDRAIRKSYRGGWTYCNPKIKNKSIGQGIVLDVNSLYPYVLYSKMLPTGLPLKFNGKYSDDKLYPLYVQRLRCRFTLKPDHLPTLQVKNNLRFSPTEYLTSDDGEPIELTLTNVDIRLFFDHYNVHVDEWLGGWKFRASDALFKPYIDKWMETKAANKGRNKCMYMFAKLMLNALYGKFGLRPNTRQKYPYLKDDGSIGYRSGEEEVREPIYIPVATFTTAYARDITIRAAQSQYDRFAYADTDSLHLIGVDTPKNLEIHPTRLGAWDLEKQFKRAKFLHAKCYIEETVDSLDVTIAGLPEDATINVTWENFKPGATYKGKLLPSHVPGGICLKPIEFTIKI